MSVVPAPKKDFIVEVILIMRQDSEQNNVLISRNEKLQRFASYLVVNMVISQIHFNHNFRIANLLLALIDHFEMSRACTVQKAAKILHFRIP